jgi:hypothetical protein
MRSTYVLIEQSELHDFLRELEALHSWARKLAGLSTSISSPAPLGMPAARPDRRPSGDAYSMPLDPFASSPDTGYSSGPVLFPQAHAPRYNESPRRNLSYGSRPPPHGIGRTNNGDVGAMYAERTSREPHFMERAGGPWKAPVTGGPHRTPNVTRAPGVAHTPQRGGMYARRRRRVRPERGAENAEVRDDDVEATDDEQYLQGEDGDAGVEERGGR